MPSTDSLKRLGGGRWETRDGRFAIEPQSGTWVIVDNEQNDELGLPLVRGPFASLTAAKEAIEAARTEGPKASPLGERIERARGTATSPSTASKGEPGAGPGVRGEASSGPGSAPRVASRPAVRQAKAELARPAPPPQPRWLRELQPADQRRARDLIARLERMGVDDPERIVRAEVAGGEPALARLGLERAVAKALASKTSAPTAARAAVSAILRGADVELGVSWRLVDGEGRRIEKLEIRD